MLISSASSSYVQVMVVMEKRPVAMSAFPGHRFQLDPRPRITELCQQYGAD